ncbi:MAG: Pyrrolo-quinoline quinone [Verrucomicrobiales bacterium]|nr:Pyrrolo-quinoline quinone [Verrucomicrobiales bacterium]
MNEASNVVYIGIQGTVIALDRSNGNEVWRTHLKGSDFVNVILDHDEVLASTSGEMFCLGLSDGQILWNNRLKGLGHGLVTMATQTSAPQLAAMSEKLMRDQQAARNAASSASVTAAVSQTAN